MLQVDSNVSSQNTINGNRPEGTDSCTGRSSAQLSVLEALKYSAPFNIIVSEIHLSMTQPLSNPAFHIGGERVGLQCGKLEYRLKHFNRH